MSAVSDRLCPNFIGCLYFNVSRLFRTIDKLAIKAFEPFGLAPSQAFFLLSLGKVKGETIQPSDLADLMNLDRSTVTRLIKGMQKKKLISENRIGRSKYLTMTAKGLDILPSLEEAWEDLSISLNTTIGQEHTKKINQSLVTERKRK
ncbi:transcriptional regulator, MarR family [Leptospira ryugenii]|uniref:Transcriptional regulator, MarR family n=1 Tax=Leptospira ryugenii TaxID=1917863 RepID=A0A2P2E1J3_9LEPT|nr:MarR family transcriptional regulator [Leptospira ryugenii]GBF50758.1 transcriptional regulator, MarR family [Leptospira ryugenii]